eukprot:TRINITY_DN1553_c0_g5_i1.p1 TRINITY_DN1553_c0_g5~~TRINITY_DN1553_c0_g5_i1.p1  ORF type:complete len:369 (+),score=115.15 TRINITY_DN1553_c0_g5_i1:88-1194(+)
MTSTPSQMRSVEAVLDEVALLEAALRDHKERRQMPGAAPSSPAAAASRTWYAAASANAAAAAAAAVGGGRSPLPHVRSFPVLAAEAPAAQAQGAPAALDPLSAAMWRDRNWDVALSEYGDQLRAWVELQVDARIDAVFRGALDAQLAAARHEAATALTTAGRLEGELAAVAEGQTKLLMVVEGVSEELRQLKVTVEDRSGMRIRQDEELRARSEEALREEVRALRGELEARFEKSCRDIHEQIMVNLRGHGDLLDEIKGYVDKSHSKLTEELTLKQERVCTELRSEFQTALRSEVASIMALDEQLWLTDQRLSQRIDELVQLHLRDPSVSAKISHGGATTTLRTETQYLREPIADPPRGGSRSGRRYV